MASNILLKFDAIDGESVQSGFEKWIECQSLQFGCSAPINLSGTGLGSGKAALSSYSLSTEMGAHSSEVLKKMLEGKHHVTAQIKVLKLTGADKLEPYFELDGKKVYIDNISWSCHGSDGKMMEMISFTPEEHKWEYKKQSTDDGSLSATGAKTYNMQSGLTS